MRACASVRDAVAGAGIVVTVTSSAEPVLRGEWLEPGMHVNAVGASQPGARELDSAAMGAGVLFADRRESLLAESGDYLLAAADGATTPEAIRAELGEVLTGRAPGRVSADEITDLQVARARGGGPLRGRLRLSERRRGRDRKLGGLLTEPTAIPPRLIARQYMSVPGGGVLSWPSASLPDTGRPE